MNANGEILPAAEQDGAIIRFLASKEGLDPQRTILITSGGFTPDSPKKPTEAVKYSLAQQLHQLLEKLYPDWFKKTYLGELGWGTRSEIYHGIQKIKFLTHKETSLKLVIGVSDSFFHYWRTWIYARLFKRWSWDLKIVRSTHNMGKRANQLEMLKFIDALLTVATSLFGQKRVG